MPHPATEGSPWELGGGTRHPWSGSPANQPPPEPLGASSEHEVTRRTRKLSSPPCTRCDRGKVVKARVVVKMMVIKECSRMCARVLSKRRLGRER